MSNDWVVSRTGWEAADTVVAFRSGGPANHEHADRNANEQRPLYDARRRGDERLYDAYVTSSRAVLATPGQRCWASTPRSSPSRW